MYAIIVLILFLIVIGASFKFVSDNKEYCRLKWLELKYELIFVVIGINGVIEDRRMKENNNKIDTPNAKGKVVVITGGTRGIGRAVVETLLTLDAQVIVGCRNTKAAKLILEELRNRGIKTGNLETFPLDTSSMNSVRSFAKSVKAKYNKINVLINNAGIMFVPYKETEDGFESHLATNYLGHFLLSHLLLPELKAAGDENCKARIVNVSSTAQSAANLNFQDLNMRNDYVANLAYSNTKFAQILFSIYVNALFEKKNIPVAAFAVHPGLVNTDLFEGTPVKIFAAWILPLLFKTPFEGAKPILYTSFSDELEKVGGSYISNCEIVPPLPLCFSTNMQQKLFDVTTDMLQIKEFGKEI